MVTNLLQHEQEDYADGNGIRDGGILVPLVSLVSFCIKQL